VEIRLIYGKFVVTGKRKFLSFQLIAAYYRMTDLSSFLNRTKMAFSALGNIGLMIISDGQIKDPYEDE